MDGPTVAGFSVDGALQVSADGIMPPWPTLDATEGTVDATQDEQTSLSESASRPNGVSCLTSAECTSGFCTDGVCCNSDCHGQCEACDTSRGLGLCAPVRGAPHGDRPACPGGREGPCNAECAYENGCTYFASGVTCRPAKGPCDLAETCGPAPGNCPPDLLAPAATLCRAAAGECDSPEYCTGTGVDCPLDGVKGSQESCEAVQCVNGAMTRVKASCQPPDKSCPVSSGCLGPRDLCQQAGCYTCGPGTTPDPSRTHCIDIDECANPEAACPGGQGQAERGGPGNRNCADAVGNCCFNLDKSTGQLPPVPLTPISTYTGWGATLWDPTGYAGYYCET